MPCICVNAHVQIADNEAPIIHQYLFVLRITRNMPARERVKSQIGQIQ